MSGWIKLEKDLLTDPRVFRIAKRCNASALHGVTLVLGGLAHLWMLADTHIGQDDILPLGIDEINEIIGVQKFCEMLPPDWLQVIDSNHVKLPAFHDHNGTEAKKKAQTSKRVQRHRIRANDKALQPSNGRALPDQTKTRPDQDHTNTRELVWEIGLDPIAWTAWCEYRIKIKKPLKPVSYPAAQRELAKHGADQAAVVQQSIAMGWTGLFELKRPNGAAGRVSIYKPPRTVAELEAEERANDQHPATS